MSLSIIISIAITLTLVYLLLSIATSEILEIIAALFNLRGKHLKESIINLLGEQENERNVFVTLFNDLIGNEPDQEKYPITSKLYEKYLTPALSPKQDQKAKSKAVSKIQPKQFASGLIATVREEILEKQNSPGNLDPKLSREQQLQQVLDIVDQSQLPPKLRKDISYLLQRSKSRLIQTEAELNNLEEEIADWFNYSMEYASEIYQRKVKVISFVLGLILVLAFNVDSINIVDQLSKSEVLVDEFNSLAIQVIESNSDISACAETSNDVSVKTCINSIQDQLNIALDNVDNLPIGWNFDHPFRKQFTPLNFAHIFNAILGWVISAIAISMGAPFWFNVLKKLVNIKASQTPPVTPVATSTPASQPSQTS